MSIVIPMSQGKDELLVERYRAAVAKQNGGRAQWIEGTLERAAVVLESRRNYPDHRAFGRWLEQHGFHTINKNERTALLWMGANPALARTVMEQNNSTSPELTYRGYKKLSMPNNNTLPNARKGANSFRNRPSGSMQRKRAMNIPTVMRDDYEPGSVPRHNEPPQKRQHQNWSSRPTERPVPILKGLTPEQVDPDFTGNRGEFILKYGLVNLHTKEQLEERRLQDELTAWVGLVSDCAKVMQTFMAAPIDHATLQQWMLKPGKSAKLKGWFDNIERAYEKMLQIQDEFKR